MYFVSCIMCHFSPPWLILTRWMRQVCPKRRYTFTAPHLVISRKTFNLKVSTIVALCCRREPVFLNFDTSCPCAFRRHSLNISTRLTWVTPNYSPLPPTHTHTLLRCFAPWERAPGILWIGSWVVLRTGISAMKREKLLLLGRGPRFSITTCLCYSRVMGGGAR